MAFRQSLLLFAALPLLAQTGPWVPAQYYRTFSHSHAVARRIQPGEVVSTRTVDSSGVDFKGETVTTPGNPLTGPFYVEGAAPGDALLVKLRKVRMNRKSGYTGYRLGTYSVLPEYVESFYPNHYKMDLVRKGRDAAVPWDLDLERNTVKLREPVSTKIRLEFPARPMLGCIGVAAAGDFAPTSGPAGPYGGNLDYNEIVEGATVILPVYHPGGLLFMGDGHALMADGEPIGTGIETSMDVEFSVELKKAAKVTIPRVVNTDYLISVGAQAEFVSALNQGLQMATTDMVKWLIDDYQLEPWAAHQLIGAVGKYDVVTVAGTVALRVPKKYLEAK